MCSKIVNRRRGGGGVAIGSDACETPIHETNREVINNLLSDGHEFDDDIFPALKNKPSPKGDTVRPVYKEV